MYNFIRRFTGSPKIALEQLSFTYLYLNLFFDLPTTHNRMLSIIEGGNIESSEEDLYSFSIEQIMQHASKVKKGEVKVNFDKCRAFVEFFLSPHEVHQVEHIIIDKGEEENQKDTPKTYLYDFMLEILK